MAESKKILICEDDELLAKNVAKSFEMCGYKTVILTKEKDPEFVVKNIESIVKEEQPDYVIIDELRGHCYYAIEKAKKAKSDVVPILYTGDTLQVKNARKKNYKAFKKPQIDALLEFLENS